MNLNYIVKDRKQLVIAEIAQSHDDFTQLCSFFY